MQEIEPIQSVTIEAESVQNSNHTSGNIDEVINLLKNIKKHRDRKYD